MKNRENFFAAINGLPHDRTPYSLSLCDQLIQKLKKERGIDDYEEYYDISFWHAGILPSQHPVDYSKFYIGKDIDYINEWGDGHKYGGTEHFTYFISCMENMQSVEEVLRFPIPDVLAEYRVRGQKEEIARLKSEDKIVIGNCVFDIFEPAWYLRGMERMLMDFYVNPELAAACLERVKNVKQKLIVKLTELGVDIIVLGDDVATQRGMMMSPDTWREFLKPGLRELIAAAKQANPEVLCYYHSDGNIRDIICDLIEVGVDILNPIQPECMDAVYTIETYHKSLSFWGMIGTQSTMPFGTVTDIYHAVAKMCELSQKYGKMVIAPTHLLEPEVPLANIDAFVSAVKSLG